MAKLKESLITSKNSQATKRSEITKFIASEKSRQELEPVIGELIERAHVDPLHLKNNVCALAHRHLLYIAISLSELPNSVVNFNQVRSNSVLFNYVETLRSKCSLSRLAKKVIRWFTKTKGSGKEFDYRFTGKDSQMILHNSMFLIDLLEQKSRGMQWKQLHIHAYLCLCLRNAVSLFSHINISDEEVSNLEHHCLSFYRGYSLFFAVNPSVWTLDIQSSLA